MSVMTPEDVRVFNQTMETGDLNIFTSHYFKLRFSGTWYTPEDRVKIYDMLHSAWCMVGKPEEQLSVKTEQGPVAYTVVWDPYYKDRPVFLHPHGYRLANWAHAMSQYFQPWRGDFADKDIFVVEGGTGSSKTSSVAVIALALCALIEGFSFLNVAPTTKQAKDMLEGEMKWAAETSYRKFIVPTRQGDLFRQKPYPTMTVQAYGHKSIFSCMTLGQHGNVILGDDRDWVNVDEAGLVPGLGGVIIPRLATRMRGMRTTGKPRMCRISFITNPHDNPSFERLLNKAKRKHEAGERFFWAQPAEADNPAVLKRQIDFQEELIEETERSRWLEGSREGLSGMRVLPAALFARCRDKTLDERLASLEHDEYVFRDGMGVIQYDFGPRPDRNYLTLGDMGTRDARPGINGVPACAVLDITDFPAEPATLWALYMLDGGGFYTPWVEKMRALMTAYEGPGAYDATGTQGVLSEFGLDGLTNLWPIPLGAGNKSAARTLFILLASAGKFAWPYLDVLWDQGAAYRESGPGLRGIPDDLIATLFVGTFWLRQAFAYELEKLFPKNLPGLRKGDELANQAIQTSRYGRRGRRGRSRYGRPSIPDQELL